MGWYDERFNEKPARYKSTCGQCGVPMWLPKSKLNDYKNCSIECTRQQNQIEKNNRAVECKTCGEKFIPRPRQLRLGQGIYCSQKCNTSSHDAMNTAPAQKLAREGWKARHKESPINKPGPHNPRWRGGPSAKRERDRLAGWPVQAARRAKTKNKLDAEFLKKLCELQKWRCACCGTSIRQAKHLDHIVPLSKGGQHDKLNVQFLCPPCNMKKHSKDPVDFMREQGFLL